MGWSHPDIALEDLMDLIKGFVDILILASGYQSTGVPATWDADNIKKAIRWALFFEHVFKRIEGTDQYQDSVKELDAALANLIANSCFPQGLAQMSSVNLSNARHLVLEHLLEIHQLEDAHLLSLLTATIEMDIDNLVEVDVDSLNAYIDRLMLHTESLNLDSKKEIIEDSTFPSPIIGSTEFRPCHPNMPDESHGVSSGHDYVDHSRLVIQEILKRQALVSCLSSTETCINNLLKIVTRRDLCNFENNQLDELPCNSISPKAEEVSEFSSWNQWRSRCLSYFLDKRTIRLLSGAELILSAPKHQWIRIFEPLKFPIDGPGDNLIEIMEIDIIEYLTQLLGTQHHKLWQVPPVLAAAAIPSWSALFRMYFTDIEKQFNDTSLSISCSHDGKGHKNCDVAERIQCLYVFHIQGSNLVVYS